jgi:tRNA 2-selenouridine synthase
MSHRQPVRVTEIAQYSAIIDARTPAEFELDHIPGAINCPVLSNEERAIIGTIYKQVSPFEAKRLGASMVVANLAVHLKETFADKPANWKPLVYCWRGGLRSGSMVTWLRLVGWDAQQLAGGYKSFRHHVVEQIDAIVPQLQLRVLCGATGSAKTSVLLALQQQGAQVLDLEGLARHKGSLLGALPGIAQPSQKNFETLLAQQLQTLDLSRPVYIEGESPKIGRVGLPLLLVQHMRQSPVAEIKASPEARLAYLLRDYAYLGDDVDTLCERLGFLKEIQGNETIARWQQWAQEGNLPALFEELMRLHYDPQYERSQSKHFQQWSQRSSIVANDLSEPSIQQLAQRIAELNSPVSVT